MHPKPWFRNYLPSMCYDLVTEARPEMGREGAALHELVANWHSLTSSVRAKIVDLLRSGCELAR